MAVKRRKYAVLLGVVLLAAVLFLVTPQAGISLWKDTLNSLRQFLLYLPPVFLLSALMDVWVTQEKITALLGDHSGIKGAFSAFLLGMITAVPFYALLPLAGLLLKKGAGRFTVTLFLSASMSLRIPLLLFESVAMGWRFTILRLLLNIASCILIAYGLERLGGPLKRPSDADL